jgi:hypothetical protein
LNATQWKRENDPVAMGRDSSQIQRGPDHSQYRIEDEEPVIDADGFLKIKWIPEMHNFHFLIGTPTVPDPKRLLTEKEIAQRMIVNEYRWDQNP